jgi:hypothetical protein
VLLLLLRRATGSLLLAALEAIEFANGLRSDLPERNVRAGCVLALADLEAFRACVDS